VNICDSCKKFDGCEKRLRSSTPDRRFLCGSGSISTRDCNIHAPITRADLAARDAEISKLKDEVHSERAHWQDELVRERKRITEQAAKGVLTAIAPLAERPCIGAPPSAGFVLVGRVWHDENEVRKAAESLGMIKGAKP